MRAIDPANSGTVKLEGFQVAWETFGNPENQTILFFPSWQIIHSRLWKMQVPYFSRSFHVVTFDPPGNGKSERTTDSRAFELDRVVDYGVGLLDYLGIEQAHIVGLSIGGTYALLMAASYPERVRRVVSIAPTPVESRFRDDLEFWKTRDHYEGWEKRNANYWREDYEGWLDFFFSNVTSEPHSTKPFDDLMSWGRETTPEILIQTTMNPDLAPAMSSDDVLARIGCPVMLIHGDDDRIVPLSASQDLFQKRPDFQYLQMRDSGHAPTVRDPIKINHVISDFLDRPGLRQQVWQRSMSRQPKRILFLSSPIGLGHIPRDLEIARQIRNLIPDVQIDWLATHPITTMLEGAGEKVHPLSDELSDKSAHWESMATEHDLHCFYAFREMDEIMVHNFMVFLDAVRQTPYDLWIGDEAWEVDHYLHENPELKAAPFVFMTDFVGFLPMDKSPGSREAFLTADYNAEIIEHIDRYPWVRDRSLYFGEFEDVVPDCFGPGLPLIRDWMREHFVPVGHVLTFDPQHFQDERALRERLGYDPDRPLVLTAVGGTSAGQHLLQKVIDAWPGVLRDLPDAQCVVVAGPRIDPDTLPQHPRLTVLPYVDRLYEHFAAADLGVVQGGLTTTMELVATRRPFLYFPLRNHFEQVFHVAHRLDQYNAGVRMDYHQTSSDDLARAIIENIGAETGGYTPVTPGAAERAAKEITSVIE